jgi:hypothetical protein
MFAIGRPCILERRASGGSDPFAASVCNHETMDTLGFEPRAFRMRSGCDTTTPCARAYFMALGPCACGDTGLMPTQSQHSRGNNIDRGKLGRASQATGTIECRLYLHRITSTVITELPRGHNIPNTGP